MGHYPLVLKDGHGQRQYSGVALKQTIGTKGPKMWQAPHHYTTNNNLNGWYKAEGIHSFMYSIYSDPTI